MPTFPVDLKEYLGGCARIEQQTFDLGQGLAMQPRTAGGEVIRSGGAARLWRGSVALYAQRYENARAIHARLHMLAGQGACFWIGDAMAKPDPGSAEILSVSAAGLISLRAAAPGRVIAPGDYLSFAYANRWALHQVTSGRTVQANGTTAGIEVVPPIRPGWNVGTGVSLGAPKCLAVMVPGSLRVGTSNRVATGGASFEWTQILREVP